VQGKRVPERLSFAEYLRRSPSIRAAIDEFTCARWFSLAGRTKSFKDIASKEARQCVLHDVAPESRERLLQQSAHQ
jgi:hypothetical protein